MSESVRLICVGLVWTATGLVAMPLFARNVGLDDGGPIRITGGRKERWASRPVDLSSGKRYAFAFSACGPASGFFSAGTACAKVDVNAPGIAPIAVTNVFRSLSKSGSAYSDTFHFTDWLLHGTVRFGRPTVTPVVAHWTKLAGGLELGHGERIVGNVYTFETQFSGVGRNDSRPLLINRAPFNSTRWCFGPRDEVVYKHELKGRRFLSARVTVTSAFHARGAAKVEVSSDGKAWLPLCSVTNTGTWSVPVPASLLPAREVLVRICGESDCSAQIHGYALRADIDGHPLDACGGVRYIEEGRGRTVAEIGPSPLYDETYGANVPGGDDTLALWTASSGWKIPRHRSLPSVRSKGIALRTAANEAEAVQLVVRPVRNLADVRLVVSDLADQAGHLLPASSVDILRVGYVWIDQPSDYRGCRDWWPDPLLPQDGACAVGAGENQPFWIRVKPPRDTPPGIYRGTIAVITDSERRVPFAVEVFGFNFPDRITCETAFGFSPGLIARYHGLETDEQRRQVFDLYYRAYADHHMSLAEPTPMSRIGVSWEGLSENPLTAKPVFDWTSWDRDIERALTEFHATTFQIPVKGLGSGDCEKREAPVFLGYKGGTPEYEALISKYLSGVSSHLKEKGWLDKAYVYWFDEPNRKDYPFVMNGFETLRRYAPGVRLMLTEEPDEDLLGGPNLWCPMPQNLHSAAEAAARARGDRFWWYICTSPKAPYVAEFIDHPGSEMRLWLWQTWGEKISGVLVWATEWWTSRSVYPDPEHPQNPYEDAMSWYSSANCAPGTRMGWGNGEGRCLYPPIRAASGKPSEPVLDAPVVSCRMEMLRDGLEDYEYFAILRRHLEADGGALDAVERKEYESLLAVPQEVYRSLTEFSIDPSAMERHRVRLARAIGRFCK